jgi:hypothetical protein
MSIILSAIFDIKREFFSCTLSRSQAADAVGKEPDNHQPFKPNIATMVD